MNFEGQNNFENNPVIEIEKEFEGFIPEEFKTDPFGYFEKHGTNIKSGEVQYDEVGAIKEDPTATKDLPVWKNKNGEELRTVGKSVNTTKSQIEKSGDPFYEYSIMEIAKEFGLPAPQPIAKISRGLEHLIVMKKIEGIRWTHDGMKPIHEANLSNDEKQDMLSQAQQMMTYLQRKFEAVGLMRNWKLKDMVFVVDIPNHKVLSLTPTDWERTKINVDKLTRAREGLK